MVGSNGNIYFSGGSSRISYPRKRSNSEEQSIIPHILALPCESNFHPYLDSGEHPQNISVQFMHSCPGQDATQLDSDILPRHVPFGSSAAAVTAIAFPESSQRTTSHTLIYATEPSGFADYSSCDSTLHATTHSFRRGSWPSHSQAGYSSWIASPPRIARSPVSEPPESTSDESYQDSDVDEVAQMSPMMNQFQVQSSQSVDPPPQHVYHAQALQPSVVTFQLHETMSHPIDDPENGQTLRSTPDMSMVADDESEVTHPSPSSPFSSPSCVSFGSSRFQGSSMRLQHDGEKATQLTNQFRVPTANSILFPSPNSPTNPHPGDQSSPGLKQQKKSKMHTCSECNKMFPRPSGLQTHMNTHTGARPYKCIVANCEKSFAVRSNAKRHLRTHGINPSSTDLLSRPHFAVGFEEPMVTQVHDAGRQPSRYRWIPHNPSPHEQQWPHGPSTSTMDAVSHTGIAFQASMSSTTSSTLSNGSEGDYDEVGSSNVADVHQSQGILETRSGTFPIYRERTRRG